MSSDTFNELFIILDKSLVPCNQFYSAHRQGDNLEFLEDHLELCGKYFLHIIDKLELEPILDELISDLFGEKQQNKIKQIILYGIYYHDVGKLNPNFQIAKVKGNKISGNSYHSLFSEKILTSFLLKKFPNSHGIIYLLANIIRSHHSSLTNFHVKDDDTSREEKELIQKILHLVDVGELVLLEDNKREFFKSNFEWSKIFLLVKLLYSLLVLSDSYSTLHYTYSLNEMYSLNTINQDIREKMIKSYSKIPYNSDIDQIEFKNYSCCNDINELRREILIECNKSTNKLLKEGNKIFMLAIPTGGGKTNISMKMALNILDYDQNVKRLFYVFPYINIIEQNYKAINDALFENSFFPHKVGLVSDIYSRAYVDKYRDMGDEDSISKLKQMMIIRDDNFLNNCVNVITNVNFFNCFIKTGGTNRYKIANLCNSIVIIDEIQTLSDKNIRVFYNFISETSKNFNIYYIVMSATLPNLNSFLDDAAIPQVISNPQKYYNHQLFKRNEIHFRLDINDMEGIKQLLIEEINTNYQTGSVKVLVTLNVVDTSRKVYEELTSDIMFNDFSFCLLNSTISNLRRKKLIEELKNKSREERIIIVSTQSIEAGVDIDCDFGIRDYSIIDSIEQISGRINRECNEKKASISKLFVIKYKDGKVADSKKIYSDQERYKILSPRKISQNDMKEILICKRFDEYYHILSDELKKIAKDSFEKINREINDLHYQTINNELNVIDDKLDKIDIFVCEDIPLEFLSEYDRYNIESIISDSEIQKLEKKYKIICNGKVVTENVYKVWKEIITSTDKFKDIYLRRKITSLLNQFIISIINIKNKAHGQDILGYLMTEGLIEKDEKFDIILSTPKFLQYYSFTDGLRLEKLKEEIKNPMIGVII
ncbi:CRISPR-associated helicase Cas3' [Methanococcoides orientis]|uniref:CRISPR-associated helicase Cas3' n=1 Tax=Methanococcoides orientis TaxID=2822137 RepID=UPI001E587A79|nr:CRISPR-associated helicase Cas3' [Methanococcoides orientis]UGV41616.1 CRISPR-associated helicase Cas3' [Methanococcoides orientis]